MAGATRPAARFGRPDVPGVVRSGGETLEPLTANLVRFFADCGVMKAAVDAAVQSAK